MQLSAEQLEQDRYNLACLNHNKLQRTEFKQRQRNSDGFWCDMNRLLFGRPVVVIVGAIPEPICPGCFANPPMVIWRGFGVYPKMDTVPYIYGAKTTASDLLPPMCLTCLAEFCTKRQYHHAVQMMLKGSIGQMLWSSIHEARLVGLCGSYLYSVFH